VREGPILFCYDGSPEARHAIDAAGDLLRPRHVVVLNVGPLEAVSEVYAAAGPDGASYERELHDAMLASAEEGAQLARKEGFPAEARAELDTDVWRSIVDVAHQVEASVVVLGSRGLHGLRALVEGDVSHQVAIHANRPVLVVPSPAALAGNEVARSHRG
jgi:nucleotide-binding universal stress UspA family protein